MQLFIEVTKPKSLVLSTELSEPDIMAEGLCSDVFVSTPDAAAAY